MSAKRVFALAGQNEQTSLLKPIAMDDGSGKPPNKGIITDQMPRLPYCILIIDESPTVRGIVKACLEREGMLVFGFPDGDQALHWLDGKICKPHVVLLDVDVSKANRYPLVHHLKTQSAYAHTALVALSRNKSSLGRLQGRLAGVQDVLSKPFQTQDLLHAMQRNLKFSQTR